MFSTFKAENVLHLSNKTDDDVSRWSPVTYVKTAKWRQDDLMRFKKHGCNDNCEQALFVEAGY